MARAVKGFAVRYREYKKRESAVRAELLAEKVALVKEALVASEYHLSETARALEMPVTTLWKFLQSNDLDSLRQKHRPDRTAPEGRPRKVA